MLLKKIKKKHTENKTEKKKDPRQALEGKAESGNLQVLSGFGP